MFDYASRPFCFALVGFSLGIPPLPMALTSFIEGLKWPVRGPFGSLCFVFFRDFRCQIRRQVSPTMQREAMDKLDALFDRWDKESEEKED